MRRFILVLDLGRAPKPRADSVTLAKASTPPLTYASIGTGSVQHMSMEFAKQRLGFEATHVPYRAVTQSVTHLMGGHVAASFLGAGVSASFLQEGGVSELAASPSRTPPRLCAAPP